MNGKNLNFGEFLILTFLLLALIPSCKKDKETHPLTYLDYLSDKSIRNIVSVNGEVWIESSSRCDTCYEMPHLSEPKRQLTNIRGKDFDFNPDFAYRDLQLDKDGNLYALYYGDHKEIYRVNDINDFSLHQSFPDFGFMRYAFDFNNNLWLSGYQGFAFWDGSELTVYNESTSDIPSNMTHSLVIDHGGVVWVAFDYNGLIRIKSGVWEHIPWTAIPGLQQNSYLSTMAVDQNDRKWFKVFTPGNTGTNILSLYDGAEWTYHEPPNASSWGHYMADVNGRIWFMSFVWENFAFKEPNLSFYKNFEWFSVDVRQVKSRIMTVNVYENKLLIGTQEGLYEIELPRHY
jgi:hypothetical protein